VLDGSDLTVAQLPDEAKNRAATARAARALLARLTAEGVL
jgi:hypothetical protein